MLRKLLKSQSGFSIVQGLILAAAVAGMAYVGTILMNEQKLAQRGVQARTNNERLHEMIYSILQNKDHCTATIATFQPINSPMWALGSSHDMNDIRMAGAASAPFVTKSGSTYASNEKYMNGTLGIESIILTYPTTTFENHAVMAITYERLGKGYMGQKIEKKISIKLQKDSTNRFQSCYAVETGTNQDLVKNFCNNLGSSDGNAATVDSIFEWDPATNSCKLKDLRCPIGQIYSGFDSTGVRRCHTIQQWSNLGNFIDTAASAICAPANAPDVRFVFTTGARMRVDCGASATPPPPPTCTSNAQCPTGQYCNAALGCQPITGCTTPWGATLNIGDTVTAYQSSSPVCPSTCVSQTRTCTVSGTLSGSYTQQSCTNPTCSTLPVCCPFNGLMMPDCMSCPPLPYGAPNMCTTISLQCY